MFDSREYLQALEAPTFIATDGTHFRGRMLSVEQWAPFEERLRDAARGEMRWSELTALLRDLTVAFFPRGWRIWRRSFWRPCWWHVRRLPPVGQLRAVWSFMRSQGEAAGWEMPTLGARMQRLLGLGAGSPSAGS